jgi:hypothetical protein
MVAAPLSSLTFDTALRQAFAESSENTQISNWLGELAFQFSTTQPAGETYSMLSAVPEFKKWQGEITAEGLTTWQKTIVPSSWHDTIFIPRNEWRFDKFGVIQPQIATLAQEADNHKFKLVTNRINNGHAEAGIDGANFFSTLHQWNGGAAQSNLVSVNLNELPANVRGTGTQPSAEEAGRMILRGARVLMSFRNSQGNTNTVTSARFIVMVPMHYMEPYSEALGQVTYSYGVGNPIPMLQKAGVNFTFSLVVNPQLDESSGGPFENSVAMFRTDHPMKPLAIQELSPITIDVLGPDSEHARLNPNYIFSAKWEGESANMFWFNALKLTHTRS